MKLTQLEQSDWQTYHEDARFRNKAEGRPSSIKNFNPYARLRPRKDDPRAEYPKGIEKVQNLSLLPEMVIQAIIDAATVNVGVARLNESLAIIIGNNLRELVTLEHLCDDEVDFAEDRAFRPPKTLREADFVDGLPASVQATLVQTPP